MTEGGLVKIIRNTDNLYEGELVDYFQILFFQAQNLNHSYHNFRHMTHLVWLCYQACEYYADCKAMTRREMRNLLIAAMFHDFDHSGQSGDDADNIVRAIEQLRVSIADDDRDHFLDIANLIKATEFPHHKTEPLSLSAQILRDADLAQVFSPVWIQQIVFGLARELQISPLEMLTKQETFLRSLRFVTDWAKKTFPDDLIADKITEVQELLLLLNRNAHG